MRKFKITGMSCAACSTRVEKAVSKLDGVDVCSVNLLTNSMNVEGSASDAEIISAVEKAGYGAGKFGEEKQAKTADIDENKDFVTLKNRLIWSVGILAVLMYVSMGHMMWGWKLPSFLSDNHVAMGLVQLILSALIMVINQKFFISGFKGLLHRAPNMDTLVALGSGASFVYSTYALFAMTDAQLNGNADAVKHYMHEFYFESAAMILALITVGKMLEAYSKGKTTNALKSLMKLAPKTAVVIRDGKEVTIPADEVQKGDVFIVRAGANVPVDGIVEDGDGSVDESALTGESIPVDKLKGDKVSAGTLNTSGYMRCSAVKVGEDTTLSQIIKMVSDASATKAPVAKAADKVSGIFVPTVIVIAVVTFFVWLFAGKDVGFSLARGISVLVISCPCALGLATPVAIMVGNGVGAKNGILFKTAVSLEETGKIKNIALDKTGTITKGEPTVTDIIPLGSCTKEKLLQTAYSAEKKSEHPLAGAIVKFGDENSVSAIEVNDFKTLSGSGIEGKINGKTVICGSLKFISQKIKIPGETEKISDKLADVGKTPLFFAEDDVLLGIIAVADTIKDDSASAIAELKNMGIKTVMLTGDNQKTADAIGKIAGVDTVFASVMPNEKESAIRRLKESGKTAMVGDGINDAPALTSADVGIAIGAGTDIAVESADVVLMKSSLSDAVSAVKLSRATLRNIHENLFWAFFYNVLGIPLAAGVFIPLFNLRLNPMFAAFAMSLSSFCVVTNALRLNLVKIKSNVDKNAVTEKTETKKSEREGKIMEKTLKIEGMMCGHCEATVKKCLEAVDGVVSADVSHTNGTAVVKLDKDVPYDTLKSAVENQGYKVIG